MPIVTFPRLIAQLLSWLVLAAAVYLIWQWIDGFTYRDVNGNLQETRGYAWQLVTGLLLLTWSFVGRFLVLLFIPAGKSDPEAPRGPSETILAPDGTTLHVESAGAPGAPTLILTHGWGLNATAWGYARRDLSQRFRIITWDLPGLGRSGKPMDANIRSTISPRRSGRWSNGPASETSFWSATVSAA